MSHEPRPPPTTSRPQPERRRRRLDRPLGLGSRQSVRVLVVHRRHPGAGLPHRPSRDHPVRLGHRQRHLDRALQQHRHRRHRRLPEPKGMGACWAVLHDKYRLDPVRPLPVRRAMAPRHRRPAVHRPLHRLRHAPLLAQGTGSDLGRDAGRRRRPDVGRHPRPAAGNRGLLGRPADHPDPGHLRRRLLLPAGRPGRPRPPFHQTARRQDALRPVRGD